MQCPYILLHRWNGETEQSGMVVMEVALPSGYKASNVGSINLVKKLRKTTSLRAAQHLNGLEVFYFDYVRAKMLLSLLGSPCVCVVDICYSFVRWFQCANLEVLKF